ncbi:MAG: flagellar basal body L-ring protein FlgH [Novosphingobium sp.]
MKRAAFAIALEVAATGTAGLARAEDLYRGGNWSALAADRKASRIGDLITIQVLQNNSASNTVTQGSKKRTAIDGSITASTGSGQPSFERSGGLSANGAYEGQGTNARANRMAAQLSATVTEVLPNGDLVVSGWQALNISGERVNIRVSGRVRSEDINSENAIVSSRLADARIEYDGKGFASRSAKPGIVHRIFNWFGIL